MNCENICLLYMNYENRKISAIYELWQTNCKTWIKKIGKYLFTIHELWKYLFAIHLQKHDNNILRHMNYENNCLQYMNSENICL